MYNLEQEFIKAQRGNRESFIQLCRKLEIELYDLAKCIVRHDEEFMIAFQNTMLEVYTTIHTFREPEHFKTQVIRILIHECNQLMQGRREAAAIAESPHDFKEAIHDASVQRMNLRDAVNQLGEDFRIVIHLSYFQNCSIKQIAYVLHIEVAEVKIRLRKARERLAEWSFNSKLFTDFTPSTGCDSR
ncbi:RNA polymerase sigma factor [Paenibacillus peoriae]|uniref:RNA polymerase sigma factor n=1 Tax=Paenibacillus peoriae TaxID=59893 RepID=UPI00026C611B|nr:RNA polymerase sigma factor [Paenibacillus peoriae]MEC0184761.1 RNA polymerase sigma factor [Paenibacillus peoriae]